jgi:hypothetical protein
LRFQPIAYPWWQFAKLGTEGVSPFKLLLTSSWKSLTLAHYRRWATGKPAKR